MSKMSRKIPCPCLNSRGASRNRLETSFKTTVLDDGLFQRLLSQRRLLCLRGLREHHKFGLLVLQHAQLGADPGLQVETRFLISRRRNGRNQALNGGKSPTHVSKRLMG